MVSTRRPANPEPGTIGRALEGFTRQLAALRARSEALLGAHDPVPPPAPGC